MCTLQSLCWSSPITIEREANPHVSNCQNRKRETFLAENAKRGPVTQKPETLHALATFSTPVDSDCSVSRPFDACPGADFRKFRSLSTTNQQNIKILCPAEISKYRQHFGNLDFGAKDISQNPMA